MYCPNCGAEVQGRFCAKCGTAVNAGSVPSSGPSPEITPGAQPYSAGPTGAQPFSAPAASAGGITQNVAGALCYVGFVLTGVVFLALAPYNQNKFIRFHAFQSIFLTAAWIISHVLEAAMVSFLPWPLIGLISMIVTLGLIGAWLVCMFKAFNNERFKLPVIGDLAEKQA
jgi:uncharacterized membrane protein